MWINVVLVYESLVEVDRCFNKVIYQRDIVGV